MKILLTGIGSLRGHLVPMLAIGERLAQQGHQVAWYGAAIKGLQLDIIDHDALMGDHPSLQRVIAAYEGFFERHTTREAFRDPQVLVELRGVTLGLLDDDVTISRRVMQSYEPDVVAIDGALYGAMAACFLEGVRFAGIGTGLQYLAPLDFPFPERPLEGQLRARRAAAFERYGCAPRFREWYCLSPYLNVVFAGEAVVGDVSLPPQTELVGPLLPSSNQLWPEQEPEPDEEPVPPFPFDRLSTTRPIVYISFGSLHQDIDLVRLAAEAVADHGAQPVVVASGGLPGPCWSDDAIVVPRAPQVEILQRAAGFITHGGANSLMEAMHAGVPVLVCPLCTDQPLNASFIEAMGPRAPGLVLDPATVTDQTMHQAVAALLEGPHRAHAERIAQDYRRHDGAAVAARKMVALSQAPVIRSW